MLPRKIAAYFNSIKVRLERKLVNKYVVYNAISIP